MSKQGEDLRISQVPMEHLEKVFKNLVEQRGVRVIEDVPLRKAFVWFHTEEGHKFWSEINKNVTEPKVTKQQSRNAAIHAELSEIIQRIESLFK